MSQRKQMMGVGVETYEPKSVQQAPGKRGERQPSYNTGRDDMNKKLNQVTQAVRVPKSTWFVLGSLLMIGLYLYHALFSRN
ncbi:hypothetical protein Ctob_015290 [Chrysochromulina tobinii]|uniref:Uncharacterized protein n=1 Tax=Chrysochromulina tobinii TaxID=1460289 RepID=A0A0M0LPT1_9EUKA|nr:hypothetical protein Ctob_015290 [Chrysochromulina tobinii]|eukprot:KOO53034.1 hypothetical protein Ctob_015290 [Chrysochromulina sp. CCMP291]